MATYANEHNTVYVYKNQDGSYSELYFKTVAQQTLIGNEKTAADHVKNNTGEHLTVFDVDKVRNSGSAYGLLILDENGQLPIENLDPSYMLTQIEYANTNEMLEDATVKPNALVMVLDASGDPTVARPECWAIYRRLNNNDFNILDRGWLKVAEGESLDIKTDWASLCELGIMPRSSVEDIDEAVELRHEHSEKETLDGFLEDADGRLRHNGRKVGYMSDVTLFFVGDYIPDETVRIGDMWIKSSPGQMWWNDPGIEYAGLTCYEKYKDQDTMVVSPKLRTEDCINFRRTFYRCYSLEEVQQYDMRAANDLTGYLEECTMVKAVPCMNTYSARKTDRMFYGDYNLMYSPEMYLNHAVSVSEMYSGCPNMVRVLPFGNTRNVTNMKAWFNGCSALERIDSVLDFSSIVTDAAVADIFNECYALREVRFVENTIKVNLNVSNTDLSYESLISLFKGLVPITDTSITRVLDISGIEDVEILNSADYKIATDKGWSVLHDGVYEGTEPTPEPPTPEP